jgi:hypothetical protein
MGDRSVAAKSSTDTPYAPDAGDLIWTEARPIAYAGIAVPSATLEDVRAKLAALIGIT